MIISLFLLFISLIFGISFFAFDLIKRKRVFKSGNDFFIDYILLYWQRKIFIINNTKSKKTLEKNYCSQIIADISLMFFNIGFFTIYLPKLFYYDFNEFSSIIIVCLELIYFVFVIAFFPGLEKFIIYKIVKRFIKR